MKRRHGWFAALVCLAVALPLCLPVTAENATYEAGPAETASPAETPSDTYEETFAPTVPDGVAVEDVALRVELSGALAELTILDVDGLSQKDDWAKAVAWYADIVAQAAKQPGATDARKLYACLFTALTEGREEVGLSMLLPPLKALKVTMPYYPELADGAKGEAVTRLQQRLVELGYLEGTVDGHYGPLTAGAVGDLQTTLREREQAAIDAEYARRYPPAQPESLSEDASVDAAGSLANDLPAGEAGSLANDASVDTAGSLSETSPDGEVVAAAEPPAKPEPATVVDGIADAQLQKTIYAEDFAAADRLLQNGDSGADVVRLQRRLAQLGCLVGAADGIYGGDTQRAVRIFQHYNDLTENGAADLDMQKLIFSALGQPPEHPLMTDGSEGDTVKQLQTRLRVLGFMTGPVDGSYGASTRRGVEALQTYLRERERQALIEASAAYVTAPPAATEKPAATAAPVQIDESLLTVAVNGVADPLLLDVFFADSFPALPPAMDKGAQGLEVERLQRRLYALEYLYGAPDGDYGGGTASALVNFQTRNGLAADGVAGAETIRTLFSAEARKALKPYLLKVSVADQRVYAYAPDANEEYTILKRTMKCSTGTSANPTPKGTYQSSTGPGARWHYFTKYDCWAQYAFYIQGNYLFHSVLYGSKNGAVTQSSVNNLGRRASHGCVRLSVEDAKWVYNNCPRNTKVVVY